MKIAEHLGELPEGFAEANDLVAGIDDCLNAGFSRLSSDQSSRLTELAGAFSGSPLGEPLNEAVAAMSRSEFLVRHFYLLAAARAALQGAQYDALRSELHCALGHESTAPEVPAPTGPGNFAASFGSVQQWLMEIAITGFAHLEEANVAPFMATLENVQQEPELTGLASLLTGYVNELLRYMPVDKQAFLPIYRWADLWTAAMVRTQQLTPTVPGKSVDGVVVLLGTSVQNHENFVEVNTYGILDTGKSTHAVRIPLTSYKVDIIHGAEIWDLFGEVGDQILKALEKKKALKIEKAELLPNGDLILRSKPKLGKASDPFSVAENLSPLPPLPPLARHPVQLAELVCVEADGGLPIAEDRLPVDTEITAKVLKSAKQIIGLLRFDGGQWQLQPLSVETEKSTVMAGESTLEVRAKIKKKTLPILRERSGKLLRS